MSRVTHSKTFYLVLIIILIIILGFFVLPKYLPGITIGDKGGVNSSSTTPDTKTEEKVLAASSTPIVKHLSTPEPLKGIYMSACVAATPSFRAKLVKLVEETELNAIVIDVKDFSGTVSFKTENPLFKDNAGGGCRVADMREFLQELYDKGIYRIARISAFQDLYMTKLKPDWAVKKNSDRSVVWKDGKGISFIDANSREMWDYLVALGEESHSIGFDELNFDYIRFPSDGNMKDIYYPKSDEIIRSYSNASSTRSGKSAVMKGFFAYLKENLADKGIVISADIFGMTTTNYDDLNIGQLLEDAAANFNYVAPMVYPSHYPPGFLGYNTVAAVNAHPYEIVKYSMDIAVKRLDAMVGTSTPSIRLKLRPWLQDNDYPVHYTPEMVRAQIQATYDSGLTSWMLWDAGNTYTRAALLAN
jgi:hypothetical protein